MSDQKDILVFADWEGMNSSQLMGILTATTLKGRESFAFEYSDEWLKHNPNVHLDPHLQFYPGRYYPPVEKENFGLFLDSCPDRWGRELMDRREALRAKKEKVKPKQLRESDYLLGVYDLHRQGGLRFKLSGNENFQNDDADLPVPPWTSIRELEAACQQFEENEESGGDDQKAVKLLLAPGSSLGGARPKACVQDTSHRLWIAKFPSVKDRTNVGGWEFVAWQMAKACGINMTDASAKKFNSDAHTFLTMRFDRKIATRIHFASAMTMLAQQDGAGYKTGTSYLDIVEFVMKHGASVNEDLEELWRRIVFNIRIHNTDDHLRNHGFLLTDKGWRLSPVYDVNPNKDGQGLSLNISATDNSLDMDLAREVAPYFRVSSPRSEDIIKQVEKSVKDWKRYAGALGIAKREQDAMSEVFNKK